MTEKTDLFLLLKKRMKMIFLRKEFHSQYEFMQSWIKTNTNIVVHDLFLLFKNLYGTLIWEKFRYASHKDADLFLFEKNSDLHLRKIQICFCIEKNSDLHLEKMQICFYVWEKSRSTSKIDVDLFYFNIKKKSFTCRLLTFKKEIITIT